MKFDEIAAATTKMKAAASDIFAADTNRKKFFDMVNWNAVGAANSLALGNSIKPQMSASSRPPVIDPPIFWDPDTMGKKETNLSIAQLVLPNVSDGNDLLRQLTDYGSAYGGGNY